MKGDPGPNGYRITFALRAAARFHIRRMEEGALDFEAVRPRIAGILLEIREAGFIPVFNPGESGTDPESGTTVALDLVCPHGRSWETAYLHDEEEGSFEWDETGEMGEVEGCTVCDLEAEGHRILCPLCKEPLPPCPEEEAVEAFRRGEDLFMTARCPKCASPWVTWAGEGEPPAEVPRRYGAEQCGCWEFTLSCPDCGKPMKSTDVHEEFPPGDFREDHAGPPDEGPVTLRAGKEPGRNDPCPCGSGKKYKKCCLGKD